MAQRGGSIFDKLTDPKLYTGAHKHRFDENGNGRGLSGRDRVAKGHGFIAGAPMAPVNDLSQITRANLHTSGAGYAPPPMRSSSNGGAVALVRGSMDGAPAKSAATAAGGRPGSVGRSALRTSYSGAPGGGGIGGVSGTGYGGGSGYYSATGGGSGYYSGAGGGASMRGSIEPKQSIFDRLNDPSTFTSTHRNRFSSDGRGRGAEGRTTPNAYVSPMDVVRR